jgi:septal ring factor EnvC (AmiA/AmiB activator)
MSDKYISASSTGTTSMRVPTPGKERKKRRRTGFVTGLFRALPRGEEKRAVMPVMLAVLLWGGLTYAGYAFTNHTLEKQQQYVDKRIQEVQAFNQKQVERLQEQLLAVQDEMKQVQAGLAAIEEELQLTGETIGGTNKTKQALQDRIDQLNKQLGELKASLKKLEDAARAW